MTNRAKLSAALVLALTAVSATAQARIDFGVCKPQPVKTPQAAFVAGPYQVFDVKSVALSVKDFFSSSGEVQVDLTVFDPRIDGSFGDRTIHQRVWLKQAYPAAGANVVYDVKYSNPVGFAVDKALLLADTEGKIVVNPADEIARIPKDSLRYEVGFDPSVELGKMRVGMSLVMYNERGVLNTPLACDIDRRMIVMPPPGFPGDGK